MMFESGKRGVPDMEFKYDVSQIIKYQEKILCYKRIERPAIRALSKTFNFNYPMQEYFCINTHDEIEKKRE